MECVSLFVQTSSRPCWLLSPSHWHFFSWVHHLPHANLRPDLLTLYQKQHWKDPHSSRPYSISPLSLLNPTSFFYYIPTGVIFINLNKHLHYPGKVVYGSDLLFTRGRAVGRGTAAALSMEQLSMLSCPKV